MLTLREHGKAAAMARYAGGKHYHFTFDINGDEVCVEVETTHKVPTREPVKLNYINITAEHPVDQDYLDQLVWNAIAETEYERAA